MTATKQTKDGATVLAKLTADVRSNKETHAKTAKQLTPVAGETRPSALPNDVGVFLSNEVLHDHAKTLRKFAADAIAIADGLDEMLAGSYLGDSKGEKPVDLDAARKQKEAEADARIAEKQATFNAEFEAKQQEAQAAVFDQPGTAEDVGWVCPEHGKAIDKISTRTQRQYRGCPDCNQFER